MTREEEIKQLSSELFDLWAKNGLSFGQIVEMAVIWADAHQPSAWISVEDRLPEELLTCEWVAVKLKGYPGWYKGYYSGTLWHYINECGDEVRTFNVTNWMPISELSTTK